MPKYYQHDRSALESHLGTRRSRQSHNSHRLKVTGPATPCAIASGLLGAFIVGAITLAAGQGGLAQTLSLVISSQLIVGLAIDRLGVFGPAAADIGLVKVLGVVFVLIGGILIVRG